MGRKGWNEEGESCLVSRARRGDFAAYDLLVERYRPASLALASQILRNRERAEDAVQDAFLAAYKSLPRLDEPERFGAWLAAIVRHRAFRLSQGERRISVPLDSIILSYTPAMSRQLVEEDQRKTIGCAIDELTDEIRPIVKLYYLENWSVGDIAKFLDLPQTTVKWRLHSGRKQLRVLLSPDLLGDL